MDQPLEKLKKSLDKIYIEYGQPGCNRSEGLWAAASNYCTYLFRGAAVNLVQQRGVEPPKSV